MSLSPVPEPARPGYGFSQAAASFLKSVSSNV
jgi:hypothetical protein